MFNSLVTAFLSLCLCASPVVGVQSELHKDSAVLDNSTQRSNEPRDRVDNVFPLLGVSHDADCVRQVSSKGEHEKQDRKS